MRKWLIGAILVLIAYIGYPYLTLYWIDHALLTDDKGKAWSIGPSSASSSRPTSSSPSSSRPRRRSERTGLPEFLAPPCALLVLTVVDSAVDEWVTPEKVLNSEEVVKRRQEQKSFADFVTYAFFTSPTEFRVDVKDPKDADSPAITALMKLTGLRWRVVRSSSRRSTPGSRALPHAPPRRKRRPRRRNEVTLRSPSSARI